MWDYSRHSIQQCQCASASARLQQCCVCSDCGAPAFVMQPGNLTSGAWQSPHTPSPSSSIPQHSNVKSFTASPPLNICWRKPRDEIFYSFPTTSLLCWLNWPTADQMSQVRIWSFYTLELWSFRGQSGANNSLCGGSFSIPFSCLISAPKRHNHNSVLRLFLLTFW